LAALHTPLPATLGPANSDRIEANTALIRISRANDETESNFDANNPPDDENPANMGDDIENTEAASARIAQEYRRQVRIKRLAEEIQQAEKEKREVERIRRTAADLDVASTVKKKEETAKISFESVGASIQETEAQVKRRIAAMSAFKTGTIIGKRAGFGRYIAAACVLLLAGLAFGGWKLLNVLAAQKERERKDALEAKADNRKKLDEDNRKAEAAMLAQQAHEKAALAEAARKADEERKRTEEKMQAEKEAEQKHLKELEDARLAADEKRLREENEKLAERARVEQEALRKKVEEAQRIAREKLKREQEEEAAKAAAQRAETIPADIKPELVKTTPIKPEVAKADPPRQVAPKPETSEPPRKETVKPVTPLTGDLKTFPSEPAQIPDKLNLPSGGVRLYVKASDPYGGVLSFQWKQLQGTHVDIVDPAAGKFLDGKWHSQTYFVAHEPGAYEFEVIVKNDEGVESRKKFPIEVLPPTTLK
jgi:hypothetical protein